MSCVTSWAKYNVHNNVPILLCTRMWAIRIINTIHPILHIFYIFIKPFLRNFTLSTNILITEVVCILKTEVCIVTIAVTVSPHDTPYVIGTQ
jgi:antibiotic biosynthesis monooxygenase (ABM) superfamily enzyme